MPAAVVGTYTLLLSMPYQVLIGLRYPVTFLDSMSCLAWPDNCYASVESVLHVEARLAWRILLHGRSDDDCIGDILLLLLGAARFEALVGEISVVQQPLWIFWSPPAPFLDEPAPRRLR